MPLLDVSEVLTDPDFADGTLVRVRQVQTIGNKGRAVNAEQATPFSGVVVADPGTIRKLVPEASYVTGSILIFSPLPLTAGDAPNIDADLVQWGAKNNKRYTVDQIGDYTTYGAGYVWAVCVPRSLAG